MHFALLKGVQNGKHCLLITGLTSECCFCGCSCLHMAVSRARCSSIRPILSIRPHKKRIVSPSPRYSTATPYQQIRESLLFTFILLAHYIIHFIIYVTFYYVRCFPLFSNNDKQCYSDNKF